MRWAVLALSVIAASVAARAGERCTSAPLVRVKFQTDERGHMLVAGAIAHRRTWLAVDTGGLWSLIAAPLARELRLRETHGAIAAVDAAGTRFDRHVTVPAIALGPFELKGANDFLVMRSLGEPAMAGGTLGLNVLARFDVAIDNTRRTLALFPSGGCAPKRGWLALNMLPDAPERAGMPVVAGTLEGQAVRVLVDTGSTATFIDRRFAKARLGLDEDTPGMAPAGTLATPTGSELRAWSYVAEELALDGVRFANIPVLIADLQAADVTLGQAQLQALHLHFAFAERRIYAAPSSVTPP
jgi:predicted aspartyl protease